MGQTICLDTDFLINFLKGRETEVNFVEENKFVSNIATTYINIFELYFGAYLKGKEGEIQAIKELSESVFILNLSSEASEVAGKDLAYLRSKGKEVEFRDVLIGAITKVENSSIKTYNEKHFSRIPGITIEV